MVARWLVRIIAGYIAGDMVGQILSHKTLRQLKEH